MHVLRKQKRALAAVDPLLLLHYCLLNTGAVNNCPVSLNMTIQNPTEDSSNAWPGRLILVAAKPLWRDLQKGQDGLLLPRETRV